MSSSFILMHVMNKTYLENEQIWKYYHATVILVLILSIFGCCAVIFSLYVVSSTFLLNKNLFYLTFLFGIHYPITAIAQGFIIVMQLNVDNTDILYSDNLFFIMSIIRGYCLFIATYNGLAMSIERIFATIFIKDYESKNRIWIPLSLGFLEISFSIASLFLFYKLKVDEIYLLSFILVTSGISFFIFLICNQIDIRRYAAYQKSRHMTLSERFQVAENIRTAKLFKLVSIIVSFFNFLLLSIGLVKPLNLGQSMTHLLYAIFDISDVTYAICLPTISITYNEKLRHTSIEILSKIFCTNSILKNPLKLTKIHNSMGRQMVLNPEKEQQYHFEHLKALWN